MNEELIKLKVTLMKVANNKNNSLQTRELAKEALNAVRTTTNQLNSDDIRDQEAATASLVRVFGSV